MTLTPTDAILKALREADDRHWEEGIRWYRDAHAFATALHPQGPAIVALLSQNTSWPQNRQLAVQAVSGAEPQTFISVRKKVQRVLDGEDPYSVLKGPKVRSFFRNIKDPDRPGPVTVDRHALRVALPDNTFNRILERKGMYQQIAGAYRAAARSCRLLPHEVQAITWLAERDG